MLHCPTCACHLKIPYLSPCSDCLTSLRESPQYLHSLGPIPGVASGALLTGRAYRVFREWKKRPSWRTDGVIRELCRRLTHSNWLRDHGDILVPMPQLARRREQLGHWPAGRLARWLAESSGLPTAELLHPHRSGSQARRTSFERRRTEIRFMPTSRAMDIAWQKPGTRLILVDDLATTGVTMEAAARALQSLGFAAPYAWTLGFRPELWSTCKSAGPTPYPSVTNSMPRMACAPFSLRSAASGAVPEERMNPSS